MINKEQENINPNPMCQQKLIGWLDDWGKQMKSKKNQSKDLQEQISLLSRSFNQAQQKLLETEQLLYKETIFSDKQRSLIEILKQILIDKVDDDTTLVFMAQMEQETDPKHQLHYQLLEIKQLIDKRKLTAIKETNVSELKKNHTRLQTENRQLLQELEQVVIDNENLEGAKQTLIKQIEFLKQKLKESADQICSKDQKLEQNSQILKKQIKQLKEEITKASQQLCAANLQNVILQERQRYTQKESQQLKSIILDLYTKCGSQSNNELTHKKAQSISMQRMQSISQQLIDRHMKCKTKLKELCKKVRQENQNSRYISLMKEFLSEQALKLFLELESSKKYCKSDHLERQILDLGRMEKERLRKLKECQQKAWKYRVKLLRQDECFGSFSERRSLSRSRSKLSSLKSGKQKQDAVDSLIPSTEFEHPQQFQL